MVEIVSKSKIKQIKGLKLKKNRDQEELFIVEGPKITQEVIDASADSILYLVGTPAFLNEFEKYDFPKYTCTPQELKELSSFTNPASGLAVVHYIKNESQENGRILALDDIQDPGNFGTILRTSDWFGIQTVICSKNTVDVYNPKVIQATMGAFLRMNVIYCDLNTFLEKTDLPIYGALLNGENVYETTWPSSFILLMGNEGKGISPQNISLISHPITIPQFGGTESLNVGIATGILLSEIRRNG